MMAVLLWHDCCHVDGNTYDSVIHLYREYQEHAAAKITIIIGITKMYVLTMTCDDYN